MSNNSLPANPFESPSNIAVLVVGILGVITNGILLIVMLLDPLKCFRRPSLYFIISLAFSDFFTGIASCFFAWEKHFTSKHLTSIITSVLWTSVGNSFITILFMAIERLIVVWFPIKVKSIITTRRTFIAIAITWIVSIILGVGVSLPQPYNFYVMFSVLVECFFIIFVMLVIYFKMIFLLRKSSKIFRGKQFTRHSKRDSGKKEFKDQRNLNMVVFQLAVVLIITVLPHLIIGQIFLGYRLFYPHRTIPVSLQYAPYISFPVELLNFVLNSVIYAYRLPQFRAALCALVKNGKKRDRVGSALMTRHGNMSKRNHSSDDTTVI